MSKYFVITCSEDGGSVDCLSKEELLKRIEENYWGSDKEYVTSMPKESDVNYWGDRVVIIKGEIVSPKPIEVVKKYTI